jgi:hypothetical protein
MALDGIESGILKRQHVVGLHVKYPEQHAA